MKFGHIEIFVTDPMTSKIFYESILGFEVIDGKISGDVNFETVKNETSLIVKTPNGTGPILIAMLFQNLKELML